MALVVLLRKPPEHGSIVHIRFRAAVPVEEKGLGVRVCLKTFDKRGREVDNKGKTGGR